MARGNGRKTSGVDGGVFRDMILNSFQLRTRGGGGVDESFVMRGGGGISGLWLWNPNMTKEFNPWTRGCGEGEGEDFRDLVLQP